MKRRLLFPALLAAFGVVAASCAGADQVGSAGHRMSVWVTQTGLGQDIGTLVADNARIPKDVVNGTGAVHAACGTLLTDAEKANGQLPAPDAQVTDWLSTAYGLEGSAGNDCYNAGSANKKLLAQSARETAKAEALFSRALIRIQSIDGRVPSTTTTTNNGPINIFG